MGTLGCLGSDALGREGLDFSHFRELLCMCWASWHLAQRGLGRGAERTVAISALIIVVVVVAVVFGGEVVTFSPTRVQVFCRVGIVSSAAMWQIRQIQTGPNMRGRIGRGLSFSLHLSATAHQSKVVLSYTQ